ncbi:MULTISPECIES: hypothetical protein [unclassified Bosea (in: a-proteobacteria)]|uniref:hypothetical protein n=1 Tax=unclassified Bosea (in: a-proteobacteria) TaxID=2653178 RepID=UPI000F7512C4|nr:MULTISPECIES: hypothetical protein [unclassified Bosea (in: a-proteobacteria)]AZO79614.1 hypothetical protein BLM15_19910 [Bosea sp. Tri-49]
MSNEPDFKNPNREPVTSLMDLALLDDDEMAEGYQDGAGGLPCGDNRSRSYWHGWRNGARDRGHRDRAGDMWDALLAGNVTPEGRGLAELPARIEECRKVLREAGALA